MPTPVKLSCGRARYITSGVAASPKRSKRALHRYITSAFAPAAAQTLPILQPILSGSPTGLVVALAVLAAVRLERARSERHLQDLKQVFTAQNFGKLELMPSTIGGAAGYRDVCYVFRTT